MYSVASKTNGMGVFEYDERFNDEDGTYIRKGFDFYEVDYKMILAYNYLGQDVQNLQIRIYNVTFCIPRTQQQTFLFAYSNDFSPKTVLDTWNRVTIAIRYYPWLGSVRFDTSNMDMKFHRNSRDANSTILGNLPNPNQGFQNSSIGSNVFDVIETFFSNAQAPVCGSTIFILLKRYPNTADISRIVSIIRSHHAILHVITSATPSGGSQPKTMYFVASKTNGMGAFENDEHFKSAIGWFPVYMENSPVYATTIQVSGSGTTALPDFYPSITLDCSHLSRSCVPIIQKLAEGELGRFVVRRRTKNQENKSKEFNGTYVNRVPSYWKANNYNDTSCVPPTTFTPTFLFAYSNDFSPKIVLDTWNEYTSYFNYYSYYGSVRFDTENMDIQFHTNIKDVNSTLANNLPDPNKGFQNSSIGSNVFDAIEKFFSNTQAPVCGSIILILLKRYPNEADNSQVVSLIRSHHASVYVITSATPSGGSQPKTMYSVASKTNGMGPFEYDEHFTDVGGTLSFVRQIFNGVNYNMNMDFNYLGQDVQSLQIRMYNTEDVNATIQYNLPDPNQGFQNSSIGSNVFDVIENLFSNTEAPVCGSIIFILLKRYPNEADTSRLVSLIRSHHAVFHVITSATPSGGTQPKAMYYLASKTNAMAAFEYDYHFGDTIGWFPIFNTLYPVYATTIQVSGSGTKTLPNFHPPIELQYLIMISYQDHVPDDSFQSLTFRWANPRDSGNFRFDSGDVSDHWGNGTIAIQWGNFLNVDYNITLDYTYSGHDVQNLQIRLYSWM
ncbi:hypothetical protein B9Z55_003371 [Caenorhabditis nigoni]|uniref:DUF7154 domain-containing protein n=1 Tax=Caenorhabditis nigoni TaxID=1611254 RepID=A0A2G5VPV3_9PELO|nr:hypothetical protein B9Z55_003371 [Caenorhabditis nigoni]